MIGFNKNADCNNQSNTTFNSNVGFKNRGGFKTNNNAKTKFTFDLGESDELPKGAERYLHEVAKIGDYVNYTVNPWTNEEIDKLTALGVYSRIADLMDSFNGFRVLDDKNKSVQVGGYESLKDGWRVIGIISLDAKNVAVLIVHAGFSEMFDLYSDATVLEKAIESRDWNEYVNTDFATGAMPLTKTLLTDCLNLQQVIEAKEKISYSQTYVDTKIRDYDGVNVISEPYWLCENFANTGDSYVLTSDGRINVAKDEMFGIRVVVALKPNIQVVGKDQNGAWKLKPIED